MGAADRVGTQAVGGRVGGGEEGGRDEAAWMFGRLRYDEALTRPDA